MWPLFRRRQAAPTRPERPAGSPDAPAQEQRRPLKFAQLLAGMGDFSNLAEHDADLRLWLPEPASEALRELCARDSDSISNTLRQFFAVHCYGVYAVRVMNDANPRIFKDSEVKFSIRREETPPGKKRSYTYWVPELGKNVVGIKLWMPARLRRDLQILADHSRITLSQYLREIVISRLLGHGMLPHRPEMLQAVPLPAADAWCEGRKVPMRKATKEEFSRSSGGRVDSEWVDT